MEDMAALGILSRQELMHSYGRESNLTSLPVTVTFATVWEWSGFYLAFFILLVSLFEEWRNVLPWE
jgi:hypothetical protein